MRNSIEISQPVAITANVNFWIDRDEWRAMTEAERAGLIAEHVASAAFRCDDDVFHTPDGNFSATISGPAGDFEIYDPEGILDLNGNDTGGFSEEDRANA